MRFRLRLGIPECEFVHPVFDRVDWVFQIAPKRGELREPFLKLLLELYQHHGSAKRRNIALVGSIRPLIKSGIISLFHDL